MKKLAFAIGLFALVSVSSASNTASRNDTIERIEALQLNESVFTPDSPFLMSMLQPALQANPGVGDEELHAIRIEAAPALSKVLTEPGGLLDTTYRTALAPLSDAELDRLAELLSDPVWRKFNASMAAPATQQQFVKALMSNTLQTRAALDAVLTKHGLKTVH